MWFIFSSKTLNYYFFKSNILTLWWWLNCRGVKLSSHSASILTTPVSHQNESESVFIPVGDGRTVNDEADKPDHVSPSRNGPVGTVIICVLWTFIFVGPLSSMTLLVGRQEGHPACKYGVLVCWWWHFDWSFAHLIAVVFTTTYSILSSNRIQNGHILVLANPDPPGNGR